ncbi:YhdP family protein [Labrys monachus]|uniref:DUF3971 domain-containing protein n=1 Tax=Labrys monachus TaxID=217067 RepID=A0ABU0FLQ0_9HYPH|nr:DUF3971 domain-containing protein [Labrys monachus]MDQ0395054.1 hypothetical protein [Labrys monachus]
MAAPGEAAAPAPKQAPSVLAGESPAPEKPGVGPVPGQDPQVERKARRQRLSALSRSGYRPGTRRRLASCSLMLLLVLLTVAGGLYWRLSRGPVTVPFLTQMVRNAIIAKLPPGYSLRLDEVSLGRENGLLTASLTDLTVSNAEGTVAWAPRVVVGLDSSSLLFGSVSARSIVVEGAAATVNVSPDGRLSLNPGIRPVAAPGDAALSPLSALNALDALLASAGTIDKVELRDATLAVHDLALGHEVTHRDIDLTVHRTAAGGVSVSLAAMGGTVNATVAGSGDEPRMIDIHASNIALRELATTFAPGAEQPTLDASFDVLARARIEPDGSLALAEADVTSNGGSWDVDPEVKPFTFDKGRISLHWDRTTGTIKLDRAVLTAGEGRADFSGTVVPPSAASQGRWTFDFAAPDVLFSARQVDLPPLKLDTIALQGNYDPVTNKLDLDRGEIRGTTASLDFTGIMTFGGRTPAIGMEVSTKGMSAVALARIWPVFCLPKAKAWVEEHIKGGNVDGGRLSLDIPRDALVAVNGKTPPLPDDSVHGEMAFSDATIQVVDTLPPLSQAKATATFGGRHLDIALAGAKVRTDNDGTLAIADGTYSVPNFVPPPPQQYVQFTVRGPLRTVAELMTHPPLSKAIKGLDINPDGVSGSADLKVKLDLPLVDHPKDADVHYSITGGVSQTAIDNISGGRVESGAMKLVIEPGLLLLTGKGVFNGLPANIDLRKAADQDLQLVLGVTLDDALRKKKGLEFGDMLTGPVSADIRPTMKGKNTSYDVDLDLTAARIKELLPGWQKPAGKPAKASFTWYPSANGAAVENLTLDSGFVSLRGDVALSADNKLRKASMSSIRLSPGDDVQGVFEPMANGWKASLRGQQFDARPLLALMQKRSKASGPPTSLAADIEVSRVLGFNDEALDNFDLTLETKGSTIRKLDLRGTSGNGELTASLVPGGAGGHIVAESTDAGAFMRFLDYYTHLRGGTLNATVTPTIDNMRGELALRSFAVENEPALGQYRTTLKNSGKASGDTPQVEEGDSAKFTKLHLLFTKTATRIGILDSVVWGPDVGVSLSGDIDYGADRVNLTGTFVPAYALNNIFSQIPVLGEILGGGQYGGLFAINFKVAGRIAAPVLTVNPLSAIAPGFLRKIFEFQKEKE